MYFYQTPKHPITVSPTKCNAFLAKLSEAKKRIGFFKGKEGITLVFEEGHFQFKDGNFYEVPMRDIEVTHWENKKRVMKFHKKTILELVTENTAPVINAFLAKYKHVRIRVSHCDKGEIDFALYGWTHRDNLWDVLEIRSRKNKGRELYFYDYNHELKSTFKANKYKDSQNMMNRLWEVVKDDK